jgi:UDP-glucose 4-epimerase
MRILLTGASSFTGFWFARALGEAGHEVIAPLLQAQSDYDGIRAHRVAKLAAIAEIVWSAPFGEARFLELVSQPFDLLCHHAARVADYRSPDFDVPRALAENTRNISVVLKALRERGLKGVVLTGSVFEAGEGDGNPPLRAVSPYGVSKEITAALVRYWCQTLALPMGKFVIPNPFGPYEEPRFCSYLVNTWRRGEVAEVRTPLYVRDNIHVDLLAQTYRMFAETVAAAVDSEQLFRLNPSGYTETQGAFTQRFAAAIGPRLRLAAQVRLLPQQDFSEPMKRINTQSAAQMVPWNETAAWDNLAGYYDVGDCH